MPRHFPTLCLLLTAACASSDPGDASFGDDINNIEVPPRGFEDIATWIEAGHYLDWNCEAEPHAPRAPSPHTRNRVCSNDALSGSTAGTFPVGSAGVKEIFDGAGQISQYAVYRKVSDGTGGDSWYWYEARGDEVFANAAGESGCTGCHAGASRDFVFTIVPPGA